MQTTLKVVLAPPYGGVVSESRLQGLEARKLNWLRCLSPVSWFGALILFFLPWVDISCIDAKGKVTTRITMGGAQLVSGGATDRSSRPVQVAPAPGNARVKVEIAPGAFKQDPKPKWIAGRCTLAVYALLLVACLSFLLVRPGMKRALVGMLVSVLLVGSSLAEAGCCWRTRFSRLPLQRCLPSGW